MRELNLSKTTAIIVKGYPRLSETFIAQEIFELEKSGLNIQIISLRKPTDKKIHPIHNQIKSTVKYLPEYLSLEVFRVFKSWWHIRKEKNYKKAYSEWRQDLKDDFSFSRLRRFGQAIVLAAELPDDVEHIHAHFLHTPASVACYTAVLRGLEWSCSAHAVDIWTTPEIELKHKLMSCSWVVTCTKINYERLSFLANDPSKVFLAYHGIDLDRFRNTNVNYSNRTGLQNLDPVRILSVGRAVEKKGYLNLLRALATLPNNLNWHLTHVGGGPLSQRLKHLASNFGINDHITWLGPQTQEAVILEYKKADIFVLASVLARNGDRDGMPNVLMEAQSIGLPCLSTNISAIPELIDNETTGLLVLSEDIEMLVQALKRLIKSPDDRSRMGLAGKSRVLNNFDFKDCIQKVLPLFDLPIKRKLRK